jgi:hypothetical protein
MTRMQNVEAAIRKNYPSTIFPEGPHPLNQCLAIDNPGRRFLNFTVAHTQFLISNFGM